MYPVLKENKIFSWETFPLCFSFPHFLLLLLSPGLSSRVSTVSFSLETPPGALSCGSDFPWGPGCMEAGTPLHAIYADFTSPSRAEGGAECRESRERGMLGGEGGVGSQDPNLSQV